MQKLLHFPRFFEKVVRCSRMNWYSAPKKSGNGVVGLQMVASFWQGGAAGKTNYPFMVLQCIIAGRTNSWKK
jgi:hypothetical protein